MPQRALLLLVTIACLSATGQRVFACSCAGPQPPCQATWQAAAVFVGEVVTVGRVTPPSTYDPLTGPYYSTRVSFKVTEAFRGELGQTVDVYTGLGDADCGYRFDVRRSYVIYGHRTPLGQLATSICSRTKPVEQAAADLKYLRGPARETSGLGTIQGVARQVDENPNSFNFDSGAPVAGARVTIESVEAGRTARYQSTTGPDGTYAVRVPVGSYRAVLTVRDGLYATSHASAELIDPRACSQVDFTVRTDGRVSGRVIDAEGRVVPALSVDILRSGETSSPYFSATARARTDDAGAFEFTRLEPFSYVLGLTLQRESRAADSSAVWFVGGPGAPAAPVVVAPEQRVWVGDLQLPASVMLSPITGVVSEADGTPAAAANVYVMASPGFGIVAGPTTSDARGRFSFTVISGRTYRLSAEVTAPLPPRLRQARSDTFTATATTPPFTLQMSKPGK